jgi:hypothetical protein
MSDHFLRKSGHYVLRRHDKLSEACLSQIHDRLISQAADVDIRSGMTAVRSFDVR